MACTSSSDRVLPGFCPGFGAALILCGILLAPAALPAAEPTKRPLAHTDFDRWRAITSPTLTSDGAYLAYAYMPQEGDGEVIIRTLASGLEQRIPVGALPPAPMTGSDSDPERPAPRREVTIRLTSDNAFAVATLFPGDQTVLDSRKAKQRAGEAPPEGLVIINLASGVSSKVIGVKNFQVPASGGAWLACLKIMGPTQAPSTKPVIAAAGTAEISGATAYGTDLVLRNLGTGTENTFSHVVEYSFSRDGRVLLFTVSSPIDSENGVFAATPGATTGVLTLVRGPGEYRKLAWDRAQTQAAFVSNRADPHAPTSLFAAYHWTRNASTARVVVDASTPGVGANSTVSGDAAPAFSVDGQKLFVATKPVSPPPDERLASMLDDEKVPLDLWRWNDELIQPLQKVRAAGERKRAYLGVLDLASGHYTQIADPTLPDITFTDDGRRAFGLDGRPYGPRIDYDGIYHDAYVVDAISGVRHLIARKLDEGASLRWSPNGHLIAYFKEREWYAYDADSGRTIPLTHALPVAFHDELFDLPQAPPSYGTAGWSKDDTSLLVYDRSDLWELFPDGRPARCLTEGFGRREKIQLRVQATQPAPRDGSAREIDSGPITLRGESESTRATGFFRTTRLAAAAPTQLLWDDKSFRYVGRAQDDGTLLLTASRFDEFPDLYTTDSSFKSPRKVSNGGAQLDPFLWGSDELIHYRSSDGVALDAMLCKPANFDPRKKYPMIVYIYERLSANLHRFFEPAPLAVIEPSFYTSNGYIVLMPDIAYTIGHPGQSAYRCVMPAVDEVVRRGFVDENAIGLEGHSWGGYETAYLITQTNRFRAAEAGAIVSNMTSAYAAIGESSGRSRQFKYEKNQSRMGATPQDAPLLYLENSPVFFVDQVKTPLLIMHDDHDDIVPWPQAVEYFLTLRRAGKEAYLFNYNNEFHSPRRRVAKEDFARRMHQFFDHFLKGAPAPAWMVNGIPYLDRDAEKIRFRDTP
ncbi:MAG: prolyl oligopeptidase family serine peptidase [Opitutus sp.]